MIQFFRGLRANYVADPNHKDGIYFATDTGELLVNGTPFGTSLFFDKEANTLKVNYVTYDEEGNPTLQHGEGMKALNELISVATSSQAGLMSAEAVEQLSAIYTEFEAGTLGRVLGVVEGEKILSVNAETKLLSSTLNFNNTLVEKDGKKYLQLLGIDNAVVSEFDVTEFIMDGVLDNVEVVEATEENQINGQASGKFVEFTWNTGKKDYIAVSDLAKTYTAGEGIAISATNEISVSEVGTDITKTTEEIPVAGGPLAKLLNDKGITKINADTDMQSLLFQLFCKEEWPTSLTFSEGTVKSTMSAPSVSITLDGTSVKDKTVEVGTVVTISGSSASAATPAVNSNRTYSGFTYGYSLADDNTKDNASTSITAEVTSEAALNSGNYSISRTYSKFNSPSTNDTNSSNSASVATSATLASVNQTVIEGDNKVTVSVTGPTASATFGELPVYYACSNVGNTHDAEGNVYKASEAKEEYTATSSAASNSASVTVKGARYMFWGAYENEVTLNSANIRALQNGGTAAAAAGAQTITMTETGVKHFIVALPSGYSLTSAKNATAVDNEEVGNFTKTTVQVDGANGFTSAAYNVYSFVSKTAWKGTTTAFKLTITKG